mgnify:CR=1 FL=1
MLKVKLINKAFILLTIIFVLVLLIDIYVKLYLPIVPYRYISKPFVITFIKNGLAMYISSDEEIIQLMDKIGYLEIVIKYLEGIIKSIDNRGWDIKNAIEWKKFEAGMI